MSEDIVPEVQARTLQLKTSNNNLLVLAISAALLISIAIALWYILKRKNGGKGGGNKKHGYSPTSFDKDADSSKRINELPSQIFTPDSVEIDSKKLTISELEKKVGKI